MQKILKYSLAPIVTQLVSMPRGAKVLNMVAKEESIDVWALVDPDELNENRFFFIFATDLCLDFDDSKAQFLGTVFLKDPLEERHVFVDLDPYVQKEI